LLDPVKSVHIENAITQKILKDTPKERKKKGGKSVLEQEKEKEEMRTS
jgi:hypothetical protein